MKLYFSPGACSMSCHIALAESGLPFEVSKIDLQAGAVNTPEYKRLSPLGVVPVLQLDDGRILLQNLAIITYVADLKPEVKLLPAFGTYERAQAFQWLSFVASDLHPTFAALFVPDAMTKNPSAVEQANLLLGYAERHLDGRKYLLGEQFSGADAYLYTVFGWAKYVGLPTGDFRNLIAFSSRISERPAVQRVLKAEGLI